MDDSYERAGTIGFRCVADAVQPADGRPMSWNGEGTYCNAHNAAGNGMLCGQISTGKGYTDLTAVGGADWVHFGANDGDNSMFKMARKKVDSPMITIPTTKGRVTRYDGNSRGFFWSDGAGGMAVVSRAEASDRGVYVGSDGLTFSVDALKGGNQYMVRVFVGVWEDRGSIDASLLSNGHSLDRFVDRTIYDAKGTANVCYEFMVDLSTVSAADIVSLLIKWTIDSGHGNITLQSIAVEQIKERNA